MLHKLRHLWEADPRSPLVSTDLYLYGYRRGYCDGRGRRYAANGWPWQCLRRLLRWLGRDPHNVYGWFQTREDVPDG